MSVSITIFAISGIVVFSLPLAKALEKNLGKKLFIFRLISKSDARVRKLYNNVIQVYFDGKDRASFFVQKQIPIHSKNSFNKLNVYLKEKREQYAESMRDARLIKKSSGLSEFFQNMSNIEKGNGEINDNYEREEGLKEKEKEVK